MNMLMADTDQQGNMITILQWSPHRQQLVDWH